MPDPTAESRAFWELAAADRAKCLSSAKTKAMDGAGGTTNSKKSEPASAVMNGTAVVKKQQPSKALESTAVLANKFIPAADKKLNRCEISAILTAGHIPSLGKEMNNIYNSLRPQGVECMCGYEMNHTSNRHPEAVLRIRKVAPELRYGLYSDEPLVIRLDGENDSTSTKSDVGKKMEDGFTGKAERDRYEDMVNLPRIKKVITQKTKDIGSAAEYRDKFEGLMIIERDEVLRLYEHLSQYKVKPEAFPSPDGQSDFLYAHIQVPGIADVHPSLSVGDYCLIRPVEPLQLPSHQMPHHFVYDRSRKAYGPNPVEIWSTVLRVVRGRVGKPDEVVITWLSTQDDRALQYAWSPYSPDRRVYHVRFVPNTLFMERCLTALDWAGRLPNAVVDNLILAKEENGELNLPKYGDGHKHRRAVDGKCVDIGQYRLNRKQHDFVSMCVSRTIHPSTDHIREPMLLTGPAGTGKTRTLYAAINQVLDLDPKNRILVCAPSHTAANVLAERLGESLSEKELFRLVDSNRGSDTIPFAVQKFCCLSPNRVFTLPPPDDIIKFRVIVCTCTDAHLLYRSGLTNSTLRAWHKCVGKSIESLVKRNHLRFNGKIEDVDDPHFTHLFIDEAAQATEGESLIPISVVVDPSPGSVKVEIALVGDPRQLGPQVFSKMAADNGLGLSWLERLLQRPTTKAIGDTDGKLGGAVPIDSMEELMAYYNKDKEQTSVFLNINYRCQPAFLMMPSALFYFDKLQSAKTGATFDPEETSRWCSELRELEKAKEPVGINKDLARNVSARVPKIFRPLKQFHWPIHFRGVIGHDVSVALDKFSGTNSWSNEEEAKEVCDIVLSLAKNGVKPEDIGVMAPFRGQVVRIRKLLRDVNLGEVNVGTVEDYQAVERDVIVLSLTRSNHKFVDFDVKRRSGVFRQPKMTNVALTRAEHLLVVVGNPNVMAKCPIWRQWLWFCLRNGLWYGDPGSEGHAGLELTDSTVYSTTAPGESVVDDFVTVGTLERISRRTEPYDAGSLEERIARGVYYVPTGGDNGKGGRKHDPHTSQPALENDGPMVGPMESLPGLVGQVNLGPAGAPALGMNRQQQPPTHSNAPVPAFGRGSVANQPPGFHPAQPAQQFGPGMGRGGVPSQGPPGFSPGQSAQQPFGPGRGRGGMPPQGPPGFNPGQSAQPFRPGMALGGMQSQGPPQYFQAGMLGPIPAKQQPRKPIPPPQQPRKPRPPQGPPGF